MENFPFEYPNSRQVRFAALCGICTATFVFAVTPLLFEALYHFLKWLLGPIAQFSTLIGIAMNVLKFIFKFAGSIAIFLYLDKRQPTGPLCFWINLFSQFLVLYLFRMPLMRINGFLGWFADLAYFVRAVAWPIAIALVQWGVSLYTRHRRQRNTQDTQGIASPPSEAKGLKGKKGPLASGAKIRRLLCGCLLLLFFAWLAYYRTYYPRAFYRYLDALPDPKACQVEVVYGSGEKWKLDEAQRAELFGLMKELEYYFAYGPRLSSKQTPSSAGYTIYIYLTNEETLSPFVRRGDIPCSGFFCKSPISPMGYWLNMKDSFTLDMWLYDQR